MLASLVFTAIQLSGNFLVGRIGQIRSKLSEVLLLGSIIHYLLLVEVVLHFANLLLDNCRILMLEVAKDRVRDFGTKRLQALSSHAQLPHHRYFKLLSVLLKMLEEDRKVIGDLVISDQVLGIVASVQLLAEVLAHLVYFGDGVREADVRVLGVVEANGAEHL